MMKMKSILALTLSLAVSLSGLTGCSKLIGSAVNAVRPSEPAVLSASVEIPSKQLESSYDEPVSAGVLYLSVNPEIAISYDKDGYVTKVEGRNDDGVSLLKSYTGYEGKKTREVVTELVTAIGDAGYFVEDIDGSKRQIVIEIEAGSALPSDTFLDEVVADVRSCVSSHNWHGPVDLQGERHYDVTDYGYDDTDYGPNNDGVTDYGYDDTDYGPNNDGVTDYDDTDYGPNNDGVTDYDDTDYGPNNDGVTDYIYTDYGDDYDDTDYGDDDTDYGDDD